MKKNKKIIEEDTIKHRLICLYGIFIKWIFSIFLIKIEIYIIIKINKRQIKIIDIIRNANIITDDNETEINDSQKLISEFCLV